MKDEKMLLPLLFEDLLRTYCWNPRSMVQKILKKSAQANVFNVGTERRCQGGSTSMGFIQVIAKGNWNAKCVQMEWKKLSFCNSTKTGSPKG